jgi:hypothetical protein
MPLPIIPLLISGGQILGTIIAGRVAEKAVDKGSEFGKSKLETINKNRKLKAYAKEMLNEINKESHKEDD